MSNDALWELREAARNVVKIFKPLNLSEEEWASIERLKQAILNEALKRCEAEDCLVTVTDITQRRKTEEQGLRRTSLTEDEIRILCPDHVKFGGGEED